MSRPGEELMDDLKIVIGVTRQKGERRIRR